MQRRKRQSKRNADIYEKRRFFCKRQRCGMGGVRYGRAYQKIRIK